MGPVTVQLNLQTVTICPRDPTATCAAEHVEAVKNALRDAQNRIVSTLDAVGGILAALGQREFGAVAGLPLTPAEQVKFFDVMLAAFRVSQPVDKTGWEDYRRALQHVKVMLVTIWKGLAADGLVIADLEASVYQKSGHETIGGYVDPAWYEKLQIRTAPNFRKFWEEGEVRGPIHLNLTAFGGKDWQLTQILIHESTHKFARTNDVAYYSSEGARKLIPELGKVRQVPLPPAPGAGTDEERRRRMLNHRIGGVAGDDVKNMTAEEALNNADSHAYFVMWMQDHF